MFLSFLSKRTLSGLAAGLFGLLIVLLGGWWFTIALQVIVHLALLEFFRMAEFKGIRPATKTTLVACQLLLISTQLESSGGLPSDFTAAVLPISGAAICCWLLLQPLTGSIADIAASIFGLFYLGFLPSHWIKLRNFADIDFSIPAQGFSNNLYSSLLSSSGLSITLATCLMIVACDIGAYVLGKKYGKHSLSPISPLKTIEGAFGGFFCAIIIGIISGFAFQWKLGSLFGALLGVLISLCALVGDLTESMMKRDAGLKDSGNALPGHGGILDRIDSYVFAPAIVFYLITIINTLTIK